MDLVGQFSRQSPHSVQASSTSPSAAATSMFSGHTVEHVRHPSLEMQVLHDACGRTPKPSFVRAFSTRPKKNPSGQMAAHQRLNRNSSASNMSGNTISSQPGCSSTNTRFRAQSVPNTSPMGHSRQNTGNSTANDTTSKTASTTPCVLRLAPVAEAHVAQPAFGASPLRP